MGRNSTKYILILYSFKGKRYIASRRSYKSLKKYAWQHVLKFHCFYFKIKKI